jgi:hypothetical protein
LGRVVGKLDALGNIALEISDSLLQESLLLLSDALKRVVGLLSTIGSKLDRNREEIGADLLRDGLTPRNSRKVHVAWLNKALLTLYRSDDLLGKSGNIRVRFSTIYTLALASSYRKPA